MIALQGVDVPARLVNVSLHVARGEVLVLVGPNGAGKSSLLEVMAGDLLPSRGQVQLLDRPLAAYSRAARAQIRAVLPQESAPVFAFTAREICDLGRLAQRSDTGAPAALIDAFELRPLLDVPFDQLSGGERQRAQLVRVLTQIDGVTDALLLLDEPTNQLDLRHQQALIAVLRGRALAGAAVIAAVHDLNVASALADRVVVLQRGEVVTVGTPAQTLTATTIARVFGVAVAFADTAHGRVLHVHGAQIRRG